jgi:hypothetical protein
MRLLFNQFKKMPQKWADAYAVTRQPYLSVADETADAKNLTQQSPGWRCPVAFAPKCQKPSRLDLPKIQLFGMGRDWSRGLFARGGAGKSRRHRNI